MVGTVKERLKALRFTIPVMCGYLFLSVDFGAPWALMISGMVYAGGLQFVMVPFLVSGVSLEAVFLTALVVYCLKNVPFGSFADGARQLIAGAMVVAVHLYKRNTLLSIAVGTAAYMLLIRM